MMTEITNCLFVIQCILIFNVLNRVTSNWVQVGEDIYGEFAGDRSGVSVSLSADGSIVAVGAYMNDGAGYWSGQVRVFSLQMGSWEKIGEDIDGESDRNWNGASVSLSADGSIVAMGAYINSNNGTYAGQARVFSLQSGAWVQVGQSVEGEAAEDYSGVAVDLSDDGMILAVGAIWNDGGGPNSGHVRVFSLQSDTWVKLGEDIDGEASYDWSGGSLSLSDDGSIVAIGAEYNDGNGYQSGHVRVFSLQEGSWVQVGADIDGEAAEDNSGGAVSLSSDGNTVAIGSYGNDGNGDDSGSVRIFALQSGSWIQVGGDIDGEAAGDMSGYSASLSANGKIVAIGARLNAGNGLNAGHVRVFAMQDELWYQLGSDIDGSAAEDESGISVSLSTDGSVLAIGAHKNDGNGAGTGQVRVFQYVVPTAEPTSMPSFTPTSVPSSCPTSTPSVLPSSQPSAGPTQPSSFPSFEPTIFPSSQPTSWPSTEPTSLPSSTPTSPSSNPTSCPTSPSSEPTLVPSSEPTTVPSSRPSAAPSNQPSSVPTANPTQPTAEPSSNPTSYPTSPTSQPTSAPTQPTSTPSMEPTSIPSTQPSSNPSSVPSSLPTAMPSSEPTSNPTQPTSIPSPLCAPGSMYSDATGYCVLCDVGYYSDSYGATTCSSCADGRWSLQKGSAECSEYVANVHSDVPVVLCAAYVAIVLMFYCCYVKLEGNYKIIITLGLMAGDTISDVLNALYSAFFNKALLNASIAFCLVPFVPSFYFVVINTKMSKLLCIRLSQYIHTSCNKLGVIGGTTYSLSRSAEDDAPVVRSPIFLDRAIFSVGSMIFSSHFRSEGVTMENVDYRGWIFHDIFLLNTAMLLNNIILVTGDILWPIIRVCLSLIFFMIGLCSQLPLLIVALIGYSTKLMTVQQFHDRFWGLWNDEMLSQSVAESDDITQGILKEYLNLLVLSEVTIESVPQLIIQAVNVSLLKDSSSLTLSIVSICFSGLMILAALHHYVYYFCLGYSLKETPKFDVIGECVKERGNHAEAKYNKANTTKKEADDDGDEEHGHRGRFTKAPTLEMVRKSKIQKDDFTQV